MALLNLALALGPLDNRFYVVADEATREAAVIDCGFEPEAVIAAVRKQGWNVRWLLGTHAHYDHVAGMLALQREWEVPYALHPADRPLLEVVTLQGSMFGFPPAEAPEIGLELFDGQRIPLGSEDLEVLFVPGHAPGHVAFRHGRTVWSGDVLFAGSIGRTDLPGGSFETLVDSIRTRLFPLGDDVAVLPGHGPATTIGRERRHNPFVGEAAERS